MWGMKIDTEGHEARVIGGASAMLKQCKSVILMEVSVDSFLRMAPALRELGYGYAWLSERIHGNRQTLTIGDADTVKIRFKEGMLFAIPNASLDRLHSKGLFSGIDPEVYQE